MATTTPQRDDPQQLRRDLSALRTAVAGHRAERDRAVKAVAVLNTQIDGLNARIAAMSSAGDAEGAQQQLEARAQLLQRRTDAFARIRAIDDQMRDAIGLLRDRIDPCDADPLAPLLLLPVRLETRYTRDATAVRVRIFPDDLHVDALDRGMTAAEQDAALAYWTAVWRASDAEAAEAWRVLQERVGKDRALWVALGSEPTNLAARSTDDAPRLQALSPATRRAAVARLLPDAFVVVALQDGARSTAIGAPIASEVVVGALSADGARVIEVGDARVAEGAEWLVDYAEAERIGLAVTVALQRPGAAIDQLFAFGVRRSLDPARGAPAELADVLRAHRCTNGLAFVAQGTPTNNTETDRSGWQQRIEAAQPARDVLAEPPASSNAAVLGKALGIDPRMLAEIDHALDAEQARARAMNIALWGPSWGSFLERAQQVSSQGVSLTDDGREAARAFHRDYVRGRGPLPAIRIGDQPYGILPIAQLDENTWKTPAGDRFEIELLARLRRLRDKWTSCLANVPRLGTGAIDKTMGDMLGSAPVSFAVRVRSMLSGEFAPIATQVTGASDADLQIEALIESLIWEEINDAGLSRPFGSLAAQSRPLQLPYVHESDPAFIDALISGKQLEPQSVLQALLALAWDAARRAADKESADGRLFEIIALSDRIPSASKERVLSLAGAAAQAEPTRYFAEATRVARELRAQPATLAQYQPIPATRRSFGELALGSTSAAARDDLVVQAVLGWLNARGRFNELRDALKELTATGLDERRILVAETLDCASHRLDAWLTGVVERRRAANRERQPGTVSIGAFGWVEHLTPTGLRAADGGYLHAPSVTHAATAGILRSAYLSHNADGGGDGAFAIDLASARVRLALELVDGVRQGQPLAGLVGYRIERALHQAHADRLIYSLRGIAPLLQGKLTDRTDVLPPQAVEAVAATNVVDGLDIVAKYQGKVTGFSAQKIRDLLDQKPADNPYLTSLAWPKVSNDEWRAVVDAIEHAAAAIDAVADLLLAESVHQLVQGNVARASAAIDAAASGDSPPPEPDFIATPAVGVPIVHQLLIAANGGTPWNLNRPRSAAEPKLEAWAGAMLGDPQTIVVAQQGAARITAASSGLCALDLIYDASDRRVFEQRLRAALAAAGQPIGNDVHLVDSPDPAWPPGLRAIGDVIELAGSLRALMTKARPAAAADVTLQGQSSVRTISAGELQSAHLRAAAAASALAARGQALQAMVDANVTDEESLRVALEGVAAFGVAVPIVDKDRLPLVASLVAAEAARRVIDATEQLKTQSVVAVTQAGQTLFGDGFWIVCAMDGGGASDSWDTAFAKVPDGATASGVRRFVTDRASVRDGVRRMLEAQMLAEAVGTTPAIRAGQMVGANGSAPQRWIAVPLAAREPTPTATIVSTVVVSSTVFNAAAPLAALVVDQWTEVLPARELRGERPEEGTVDARHTSGIALNADAPGARAPQAMLLGISPDGKRWNTDRVLALLQQTLDLARLRLVTLERTNGVARVLPALYEQSWSLQGEQVLNPLFLDKAARIDTLATYVKEQP